MTTLAKIGEAIDAATNRNDFGLYDYSSYLAFSGGLKAHVVRCEKTNAVIFQSDSALEARARYDAEVRNGFARAALLAMRKPDEGTNGEGSVCLRAWLSGDEGDYQHAGNVFTAMIDAILNETTQPEPSPHRRVTPT